MERHIVVQNKVPSPSISAPRFLLTDRSSFDILPFVSTLPLHILILEYAFAVKPKTAGHNVSCAFDALPLNHQRNYDVFLSGSETVVYA